VVDAAAAGEPGQAGLDSLASGDGDQEN